MVKGINKFAAKYGDWVFLGVAIYRLVFYILDLVDAFKISGGYGVKVLFGGLFDMFLYFVLLCVIIGVARKITGVNGVDIAASLNTNTQNYQYPQQQYPMGQNPVQGAVPPYAPTAPSAPTASAASTSVPADGSWFCAGCGKQNTSESAFCFNCGKPR